MPYMQDKAAIQDSDDEGSLSPEKLPQLELDPDESFFDTIDGGEEEAGPLNGDDDELRVRERNGGSNRDASVGSTARLARDMRAAHESLMAPSPDLVHPMMSGRENDFSVTPTSPMISKLVRTQTTTLDRATKNPKTYGSKTTMDSVRSKRSFFDRSFDEGAVDDAIEFLEPASKKQRGDNSSSPQLSRLLETHKNSQLPSTMSHGASTVYTEVESNAGETMHSMPQETDELKTIESPQHPTSKESRPVWGSSNLGMSSSQVNEDRQEQNLEDGNETIPLDDNLKRKGSNKQTVDSNHSTQGSQDELAAAPYVEEPKPSKSSKRKKRVLIDDEPSQDTSDIFGDLPQEQYQPRKSRSRRGGDTVDELVDNIDYSKRPETTAKAKSKKKKKFERRKTTGGAVVVHLDDEDDPFGEIQEQPFEPAKSRASKTPLRSIEEDADEETVPHSRPKQNRSRRLAVLEDDEEENEEVTPKPVSGKIRDQRLAVVEEEEIEGPQKPESKASSNKAVGDPSIDVVSDREEEVERVKEPTPTPDPQPAKKKRGRPRKNLPKEGEANNELRSKPKRKKTQESEEAEEEETLPREPEKAARIVVEVSRKQPRKGRTSTDESQRPASPNRADSRPSTSPSRSTRPTSHEPEHPKTPSPKKASRPLAEKTNLASAPTNKQATSADTGKPEQSPSKDRSPQKGPTKHSPLNNSRIKFRVGLSKRVRIEPLLRIVKKDKTAAT